MKKLLSLLAVCCMFAATNGLAEVAQPQPGQDSTDPALNAANPIAPATPSEQAVDMQTFDYESKHDVETMTHSNTPDAPEKPLPDAVIKQDVMNRFDKVYQEKKKLYDQTQTQLTAAQNDLQQCDQLSGDAKDKCTLAAKTYINTLTQKSSNLKYDMDMIQKEMKAIQP